MARSPAIFSGPAVSAGNDRTSVALFLPRNWRLSLRIAASVVSSTETCPRRRTASWASRKKVFRLRIDGRGAAFRATGDFDAEIRGGGSGSRSGSRCGSRRIIVRGVAQERGSVSIAMIREVGVQAVVGSRPCRAIAFGFGILPSSGFERARLQPCRRICRIGLGFSR